MLPHSRHISSTADVMSMAMLRGRLTVHVTLMMHTMHTPVMFMGIMAGWVIIQPRIVHAISFSSVHTMHAPLLLLQGQVWHNTHRQLRVFAATWGLLHVVHR
jgi:hypothetical protein